MPRKPAAGPSEALPDETDRLQAALNRVEEERDRYAELYEFAPFALMMVNGIGVIQDLNHAAARLLGGRHDVKGRRLQAFVDPQERTRLGDHLRSCLKSPDLFTTELHLDLANESPVPVQLRSRRVGKGTPLVATTLFDLRQRDQAAEEAQRLKQAGREAEAASAAKDQFIAMLSHELRTPLTPVLAAVTALRQKGELPESLRQVHEMIHRNLAAEARLIDDLLDATRIARGKMKLECSVTDLHEAAADVLETLSAEVQAKGHRVIVDLGAADHHVLGDQVRLRQVLWNLLRNAVKFTPNGGVIELRSWNTHQAIALEVSDNGRGFAAETAPRLFSPFEQGGGPSTGGLGLGLAICRGLVDLHRGQLTATSPGVGRGARFVLQVDTVPAPAATVESLPAIVDPAPASGPHAPGAANKPRILLVEDHADTAELLQELFGEAGYQVQQASSVQAALDADLSAVDLVVSDIGLPDGSGLELMRELVSRAPIKGIALSGFGTEADVRACKDAGFSAHITKPVDWLHLLAEVERLGQQG